MGANSTLAAYNIATIEYLKKKGHSHEEACRIVFGEDDISAKKCIVVSVVIIIIITVTSLLIFS